MAHSPAQVLESQEGVVGVEASEHLFLVLVLVLEELELVVGVGVAGAGVAGAVGSVGLAGGSGIGTSLVIQTFGRCRGLNHRRERRLRG